MDLIKDLDMFWFELGRACGVDSRKQISKNSEKITNMGKQGITTIPTEKQKISFFIGLQVGRHKIVNNLNNVKITTILGQKPYSTKGDYLTIELAEKEAIRGQTVTLPFYISNNRVDNRGFCGYQLKFTYNTDYLDLIQITPSTIWTGSLEYQHSAGAVLVQGVRDYNGFDDLILGYAEFYVKESAETQNVINVINSNGTGQATELLTYINNELYFITPKNKTDGLITLEPIEQDKTQKVEILGPPVQVGNGNSSVSYNFTATMGNSGGVGGCSAWVNVYLDGIIIGQERVELSEGEKTYTGNIPISLPSISSGNLSYEIVIEANDTEEQGFYYVFIKAGQFFTLNSEIPRNNVNELGNVEMLEKLYCVTRTYCETEFLLERVIAPLDLTDLRILTETSSSTVFELVKEEKLELSELDTIINVLCSTDYILE